MNPIERYVSFIMNIKAGVQVECKAIGTALAINFYNLYIDQAD